MKLKIKFESGYLSHVITVCLTVIVLVAIAIKTFSIY